MSLVGNYCHCDDGNWYAEAKWEGDGWFIVLDDQDPPELVVQVGKPIPKLTWFRVTNRNGTGSRLIQGEWVAARSWDGKLLRVPPPPEKYDSKSVARPDVQGVFYDLRGV